MIKQIKGTKHYFVDTEGNVYSNYSGDLKPIKACKNASGYLRVGLAIDGKQKFYSVHSLVLESFVSIRPEGMDGCHVDGVKENNRLDNLKWATRRENNLDVLKHGKHPTQKLTEQDVKDIRWMLSMNTLSQTAIAKMYNVTQACVGQIKSRKKWQHI